MSLILTSKENPIIYFEGISKRFSSKWALENASGKIYKGDKIAIAGMNGAGKSTLLHLLCGSYRPDQGILQYSNQSKKIHLITHESMLYSRLTLLENLEFFQGLCSVSDRQIIDYAIHKVGLYDVRHEKIEGFSHGMIQKSLLARMFIHKADILFLDESFNGLDSDSEEMLGKVISEKGISEINWKFDSMIFVDHDLDVCLKMGNIFWVLNKGKLLPPFRVSEFSSQKKMKNMLLQKMKN